jgi:lipopolysaccharide/colanic/teichoic acid biosynthesis glycosyltransferase
VVRGGLVSARPLIVLILITALMLVCGIAFASDGTHAVPEASACILAPVGIAAILAAERHRRQVAAVRRGVGITYFLVKRTFDILLASAVLLVSFPLFAVIGLLIRLDSPGPILFKRRAIGKRGDTFDMFKFRSMVEGAEEILAQDENLKSEYYVSAKLKTDPRITKIGKFLRKTSLDELPQLINVLLGTMTFVGPRPIAADEMDLYGPAIEQFKTVTPGITGIWQTCGRSETSYETRVEMDLHYIENRSILLDLWIVVSTVPAVLLKRGAF